MGKNILFALLAISTIWTIPSLACPGGHLKSLQVDGLEIGTVNMTQNTVEITGEGWVLDSVSYLSTDPEADQAYNICGLQPSEYDSCTSPQRLGDVQLTADPLARLTLHVHNGDRNETFHVSNFRVARDMSSCGDVVPPTGN